MPTFDKPDIDLAGKRIIAVFTAYNEAERIPFFLDYYRRMGVSHFLAIDNNSPDNTRDLLLGQPDVSYFHTSESYVASKAGRLWTTDLADHYCRGKWCLTLDRDEQLVFPGCEHATIGDLCDYLDEYGYEGIFTVFLDMYHPGPLSDAIYTPGQPFLEVCDHFEVNSYFLREPMYFPHVAVFGGPRARIFWEQGKKGSGPSMRKMPLIKWRQGFKYVYSTHSSTPARLADMTGALLHFKFFSSFASFAERELARGDRVQMADYEKYARLAQEQKIAFGNKNSIRYESSTTLVEHGVTVTTRRWLSWLRPRIERTLVGREARVYEVALSRAMRTAENQATLKLSQLPVVWSLLGSRVDGGVLSVYDRTVTGWFVDRRSDAPGQEIEARVAGTTVATGSTGAVLWDRAVVQPDQRNLAFEITIPESAFDSGDRVRVALAARGDSTPFAFATLHRAGAVDATKEFDGACYITQERRLAGWAWAPRDPGRTISLSIHIDGRFWRRVFADIERAHLNARHPGMAKHGFAVDLSDVLEPDTPHIVQVTVHGTNFQLRRSPVPATADAPEQVTTKRPWFRRSYSTELPRFGGRFSGRILAVRNGAIYGWVADPEDDARVLDVELVAGSRTRLTTADAVLPLAGLEAGEQQSHGFIVPAFSSRLLLPLERGFREVSLRIAGGEMLAESLRVAEPGLKIGRSPYRGYCDPGETGVLHGWAWQADAPERRLEVAVFIDDAFCTVARASEFRQDLRDAGIGDGRHGFSVHLPPRYLSGERHMVHVVIAHDGIPLANSPLVVAGSALRLRPRLLDMERARRLLPSEWGGAATAKPARPAE